MTKSINKSISGIFEKLPEGNYSHDARLYQDILQYCFIINPLVGNPSSGTSQFVLRDLQRWLIQHNLEFIEYYRGSKGHTSINNRIHAKEGRINSRFEALIEMGMIKRTKQESSVQPSLYVIGKISFEFTKSGILLALIVKSISLERLASSARNHSVAYNGEIETIYSKIYRTLESILMKRTSPSYTNLFFYSFLKKCQTEGIFRKLIQQMQRILDTDKNIANIGTLLAYILSLNFPDISIRKEFVESWIRTIAELEEEAKSIVLYQLKLNTQCRFQDMTGSLSKLYEEIRFKYRDDVEHIIVDGNCEKCGHYDVILLHYLEYGKSVVGRGNARTECKICHNKNGMIISSF